MRRILLTAVFLIAVFGFEEVQAALGSTVKVDSHFDPINKSKDEASSIEVIPSEDKAAETPAAQKNEIAVCNKEERRNNSSIPIINFEAQVVYPANQQEVKVRHLGVVCEASSGKTEARAIVEILKAPENLVQLIKQKITGSVALLDKKATQCKVSDKIVSFVLNDARTELTVICGSPKEKSDDYITQYGSKYSPDDTTSSDDKNGNGIPDKYEQTADEAAAAGDMSQPASATGQGSSPYSNDAYNNPYAYNPQDQEDNSLGDSWDNDYGSEEEEEDGGHGSSTAYDSESDEKYIPEGNLFTGTDSEVLTEYYEDFSYSFAPSDSDTGINQLLANYSGGISASTAGKSFWDWKVLDLSGSDEELNKKYYAYKEIYGGRLNFIDFINEAYKRQSTDFAYDDGNWLNKTEEVGQEQGWLTRSWLWFASLFKESVPTGQYYEI